jgi:predicted Rossmann-fold nucleotide-binding protein
LRSVCVFCGSGPGRDPAYEAGARPSRGALAKGGTMLVYGGGRVGLMSVVENVVLDAGGEATGVIP